MRFLLLALMCAGFGAALADDAKPPLDPAFVVKQLYMASNRSYKGAATYEIWGDGTIHFHVSLTGPDGHDIYISGAGSTPIEALEDLRGRSTQLATSIVPQAEQTQTSAVSLIDCIKSILIGDRTSQ